MLLSFLFLATVGGVIGSFLGALSYRFPRNISVLWGRSFCPGCKKQIEWYDNIPLVSFLVLKGRCRRCRRKISWRYPLIELSTIVVFLGIYLFVQQFQGPTLTRVGPLVQPVFFFAIASILIFIFIIDLETKTIPDEAVFLGFIVAFLFYLLSDIRNLFPGLAAGFLASDALLMLHFITKGRGMGLGDVKLALLGGMLVGMKLTPVWLFLAFLTGAIWGVILILLGKAKLKSAVAFGPFLVLSLPGALVFGDKIISWLF